MAAGLGVALALTLGGVRVFAPQLPYLMAEGFPDPIWPASGRFLAVDGQDVPMPETKGVASDATRTRFTQTGGRALLVYRQGQLISETYGAGISRETRLNSYSLVKSLVAVLALRAVADGVIPDLDMPLSDLIDQGPRDVTLRQALTMTSGLAQQGEPPKDHREKPLDDADYGLFGPLSRLHAFGLEPTLPGLTIDPDRQGSFHYQSANTALIAAAVEGAYGRPLTELMSEIIWRPAGASTAQWRAYPAGDGVSAYCCLYARPLDWLRVGTLLLHNGSPDQPLLPEDLWRSFLWPKLAPEIRRRGAYGLHVRHDVLDRPGGPVAGPFTYLMGHGGQVVYLLPDQETVVVRFGETPQRLHSTLYEIFAD